MITNDELIVNIIQIQQKSEDQVTETSPKKEIIPQAIEKIKKDQKKFKEKIIQEIIKEKESDQEIKPIEEIEKPKQISIFSYLWSYHYVFILLFYISSITKQKRCSVMMN